MTMTMRMMRAQRHRSVTGSSLEQRVDVTGWADRLPRGVASCTRTRAAPPPDMEAHASPGAACLPVGMTRFAAAAPGAPAMRPTYVTRRPRDVSDGEDDRDDAPPARMLFDIHACAPRDRTKADDGPQKGKDDAPEAPPQVVSDSAHLEMGRLLHRLQLDCAQPGSTPTDRMLGVCRVVLAWIATWMKPAQTVEVGALRQPGACGLPIPALAGSDALRFLRAAAAIVVSPSRRTHGVRVQACWATTPSGGQTCMSGHRPPLRGLLPTRAC